METRKRQVFPGGRIDAKIAEELTEPEAMFDDI
jgi:hypothetical protein